MNIWSKSDVFSINILNLSDIMKTIRVWSDFTCPFCYIAETRLRKVMSELGDADVRIELKAFELAPSAKTEVTETTAQRYARKHQATTADAIRRVGQISMLGRRTGLKFDYAKTVCVNTRSAHRLMKMAEKDYPYEVVMRLNDTIFNACLAEGRNISDPEVLKDLAAECGIDAAATEAVLGSDAFDDEVGRDEREASDLGINSIPCFGFPDGTMIKGARDTETFRQALTTTDSSRY